MSAPTDVPVTPELLRSWALPAIEGSASKYRRGDAVVLGGSGLNPGGVLLAGRSVLRVGAGRLTLAVPGSIAIPLGVALPESGVLALPEDEPGRLRGSGVSDRLAAALERADALLVGPGLDDPDQTRALLTDLAPALPDDLPVLADAFALGVLAELPDVVAHLRGRLLLTPNRAELERLLPDEDGDDVAALVAAAARAYGAVVAGQSQVADADGGRWRITTGHSGLATSGSGDVLAGAMTGLLARGADRAQAACWAAYLHAAAGDRLTARVGALGFLAGELADMLPHVLSELER